ncbi:tryptophan 2,3-dioxygenase family protein [Pendulispora albinea]|uniref:acireductone dioxygenase (Fe(2+)-requiring) n=1 Tax=Pendulispora albinea TaxID=2741071 RepID=A0ABZ2M701_9BACT
MRAVWSDTDDVIPETRVRAEGIHFQKVDTVPEIWRPFMEALDYPKFHESTLSPEVPDFEARTQKVIREHCHEQPEVRFCLEGEGVFEIRSTDDRFMKCTVEPGDLLIIPARRYHRFYLTERAYIRHLMFSKVRGADGQVVPQYRAPKDPIPPTRYEEYTRYAELLALLPPADERIVPDQLLFFVPHLTTALWLEVLLDDVARAVAAMHGDRLAEAGDRVARAVMVEKLLVAQLELSERITPKDFAVLRQKAYAGNGADSPGFRRLLEVGKSLAPAVERICARRGVDIVTVLREPSAHYDVHVLLRSIFELDGWIRTWRYAHFRLAERQLGPEALSKQGRPVAALLEGAEFRIVPELWSAVTKFTEEMSYGLD